MVTPTSLRLIVSPHDAGKRADVVLGGGLPQLSRRTVRQLGLQGRLYCNGKVIPPSTKVRAGDELHVACDQTPPPALELLHVTDEFVFVAKPPELHTHRLRPSDPPTLADAVEHAFPECATASDDPRESGALHRLDHATSGVVAFARTREAWQRGRALIRTRAHKDYFAILTRPLPTELPRLEQPHPQLHGHQGPIPSIGYLIDHPIGSGHDRRHSAVRHDGRPAQTWVWPHYNPRSARCGDEWPVIARLIGGRRHQLRVHFSYLGCPIVGDRLYDGGIADRLKLHAVRLDLDPGVLSAVEAPIPDTWPHWVDHSV